MQDAEAENLECFVCSRVMDIGEPAVILSRLLKDHSRGEVEIISAQAICQICSKCAEATGDNSGIVSVMPLTGVELVELSSYLHDIAGRVRPETESPRDKLICDSCNLALPEGVHYMVSEINTELSGGEIRPFNVVPVESLCWECGEKAWGEEAVMELLHGDEDS